MLYFFLLLSAPTMPACVLIMAHAPVPNDYLPPICPIHAMPNWDWYELRLIGPANEILCTWPAAVSLSQPPLGCSPRLNDAWHIEVWLNRPLATGCNLWKPGPAYTPDDVTLQCPAWVDEYEAGTLLIVGPFEIHAPEPVKAACTLPQVDTTVDISTTIHYEFLAGRLSWWGIHSNQYDWQNKFDDLILAAAGEAGVPAALLKGMISQESQFWPLWTGDAGEVGWMQVTWQGADTALRHDPDLFRKYCRYTLWVNDCTSYDLLTLAERSAVLSELVKDLQVEGTPEDAARMAAEDLWTYAHILRAYACQAAQVYPDQNVWHAAAVLYNAGTECIQGDKVCEEGTKYLSEVVK